MSLWREDSACDGRSTLRPEVWRACLVALAAGVSFQATAAGLKAKADGNGDRLVACIIGPASLTPLVVTAPAATAAEEDDDEEDDEDDEDEEDEDEEETVSGFRQPGTDHCVGLSASVNTAAQYTLQKTPPALQSQTSDPMSYQASMSIGLTTSRVLANGLRFDTRFSLLLQPASASSTGVELTEAVFEAGGWTLGHSASIFSFWTGEDFLFGARVPARSGPQIARKLQITDTWSASLSLEDSSSDPAVPRPSTLKPLPGPGWPDVVARIRHEGDTLEAHLAGAISELKSGSPDIPSKWGYAGIAGASWSFDLWGATQKLTGQLAYAVDAPVYLGTQVDVRAVRQIVDVGDSTRGYSAALSLGREWSDSIATNVYASHLRLDFPKLGLTGGRAEISRGAANIVWTPSKGFRIGLEAGLSRAKLNLPNRTIFNDPSGRQTTAILWFDHSF